MIHVTVTDHERGAILAHASGPEIQTRDLVHAAVEQWLRDIPKRNGTIELRLVGKSTS